MNNQTQNNKQDKNNLTPSDVIANAARFNNQFLNKQLAGLASVSIGRMLTNGTARKYYRDFISYYRTKLY